MFKISESGSWLFPAEDLNINIFYFKFPTQFFMYQTPDFTEERIIIHIGE
jgi:hypothetical protein